MTHAFVWFHNSSESPSDAATFYERLLGWKATEGPPGMTLLASDKGPMAGVAPRRGTIGGWIPYVEVADVDAATSKATQLGGAILQARTKGPAGDFTIIRDPGGASFALWQKA
jgi:predicted enzyme related to lactoylglutathione lyase